MKLVREARKIVLKQREANKYSEATEDAETASFMAAAERVLENASPSEKSEKTESDEEADEKLFKRIAYAVEKMLEPLQSAEMRQCQTQG